MPAIGVAMLLALGATGPAFGQQPRPLNYTDYSRAAETETDRWWQHFWGEEREVQLQQPSFSAHVTIKRDGSQQAFGIFYAPRLCDDIRTVNGATLTRCPARLARFFFDGKLPEFLTCPTTFALYASETRRRRRAMPDGTLPKRRFARSTART